MPADKAGDIGGTGLVVHLNRTVHLNDDTKLDYFNSVFSENAAESEHVWEVAEFTMNQLASNGAIVTVRWIARRPDGSILWTSRASYMVADDGNGWLIWGNMVHTPD